MFMDLPKRRSTRLKNYDYSENGYYFITICTLKKQKILCDIVGEGVYDLPNIVLTKYGKVLDKYIIFMSSKFDGVSIDKYVIMPNHIHLIIKIENEPEGGSYGTADVYSAYFKAAALGNAAAQNPALISVASQCMDADAIIPKFVSLFKRYCNREIGSNIFQRSFHDHIIRGENDYAKIWDYIDSNPICWNSDALYIP